MANFIPNPPPGAVRYQQLPDPLLFPVWYDGYGYVTQSPGYGFPRIDPPQQQAAQNARQDKKDCIVSLVAFGCFLLIGAIIAIVALNVTAPGSSGAIGFSVGAGLLGLLGVFSMILGFTNGCDDIKPQENPGFMRQYDPSTSTWVSRDRDQNPLNQHQPVIGTA